jgi:transposase-like protein
MDTWILRTRILGKECMVAKTHPAYPSAFRAEAVELARTSGKGVPQLARDLGISERALRGWIKRAEAAAGRGQLGELTTAEREERRRLRREVKVLQQEREILRKAAASFARETL